MFKGFVLLFISLEFVSLGCVIPEQVDFLSVVLFDELFGLLRLLLCGLDLFGEGGDLLAHVDNLVGFGAFGEVEHGLSFFELIGKFLELVFHEFFLFNDLVEEGHGLVKFGAAIFE